MSLLGYSRCTKANDTNDSSSTWKRLANPIVRDRFGLSPQEFIYRLFHSILVQSLFLIRQIFRKRIVEFEVVIDGKKFQPRSFFPSFERENLFFQKWQVSKMIYMYICNVRATVIPYSYSLMQIDRLVPPPLRVRRIRNSKISRVSCS